MRLSAGIWLALLVMGCFDPDLVEQGFRPCSVQTDCALACTCSSKAGVCLPPADRLPEQCAPGLPGREFPGELLRFDWEFALGAGRALELVVTSPLDESLEWAATGYEAALGQALADGELTLREAAVVAAEAALPIRIRFDEQVFGDAESGEILLTDVVQMRGSRVLLDGRDANVTLLHGGLSIQGEVIAVFGLKIHDGRDPCLLVSGSRGVYLAGIGLETCWTGVRISGSQDIWLSDGSELALPRGPRRNGFGEMGLRGVRVEDSQDVVVTGTNVEGLSWGGAEMTAGFYLSQDCRNVSIGPPPGLDRLGTTGNRVAGTFHAVEIVDSQAAVLVRGNLFLDNEVILRMARAGGSIELVHNTAVGTGMSILKHWNGPDPLQVVVSNGVFDPLVLPNEPVRFLWCHPPGGQPAAVNLTLQASHLLFSTEPGIEDCVNHWQVLQYAEEIATGTDPGFSRTEDCPYCLGSASPAVDAGKFFETSEGLRLDVNGLQEGLYCGDAPDLGAFELCQ